MKLIPLSPLLFLFLASCNEKEAATSESDAEVHENSAAEATGESEEETTETTPQGDTAWYVTPTATLEPHVERLASGVLAAQISNFRVLIQSETGWSITDPTKADPITITGLENIDQLVPLPDGRLLLFTDQGTKLYTDSLQPSPFDSDFTDPILSYKTDDLGVWFQTERGLHRFEDGFMNTIEIEGKALTGLYQNGAIQSNLPGIWVETEDGLVLLVGPSHEPALATQLNTPLQELSINRAQQVWLQGENGDIFHRNQEWKKPIFESEILQISGHPGANETWFAMENDTVLHSQDEFHTTELPPGEWLGTDGAGRLFILSEGDLLRVSTGPSLGLENFPRRPLTTTRTISLDPSEAALVSSITVSLNGDSQDLQQRPWQVFLDPVELGDGEIPFEATVIYENGDEASFSDNFVVDLGVVSWEDDIEPFSVSTCLACHGGNSLTILDSKDAWVDKIDRIISVVISGAMPQGGPVLDVDQINIIQQWQMGGFQ